MITFKVAVITPSVAKITFVVAETNLITSSVAKIIFVKAKITFVVASIIVKVTVITFDG